MALTIQDIQDKQFHVRFRGFDIDEVDNFLELITESFSILVEENKSLQFKIKTISEELDRVKNQENSFRNALISAQKVSDEMKAKSQQEADKLLAETKEEIKKLKEAAHQEVAEMEGRVDQLSTMQSDFERDVREVILSYQKIVDSLPQIRESSQQSESVTPQATEAADEVHAPIEPAAEEIVTEADAISATDEGGDQEDEAIAKDSEPDLSGLYERIDLGNDLAGVGSLLAGNEGEATEDEGGQDDIASQLDEDDVSACFPDLDSDIMFTLQDPLDDETEVDVKIEDSKDNDT